MSKLIDFIMRMRVKSMEELKVGYVYKDRRNFDVVIVRHRAIKEEAKTLTHPYEGVVMGKEAAFVNNYTANGELTRHANSDWYKDIIVESGKPWNPIPLAEPAVE